MPLKGPRTKPKRVAGGNKQAGRGETITKSKPKPAPKLPTSRQTAQRQGRAKFETKETAKHPRRVIPNYKPEKEHKHPKAVEQRERRAANALVRKEIRLAKRNRPIILQAEVESPSPLKKVGKFVSTLGSDAYNNVTDPLRLSPRKEPKNPLLKATDKQAKVVRDSVAKDVERAFNAPRKANPAEPFAYSDPKVRKELRPLAADIATTVPIAKGAKVLSKAAPKLTKAVTSTPAKSRAVTKAVKSGTVKQEVKQAKAARKLTKITQKAERKTEIANAKGASKAVLKAKEAGRVGAKASGLGAVAALPVLTATKGVPTPGKTKAAGLQILEQTARPLHATMGLATEGPKGLKEGALHNKNYTGSDLLKKAGIGNSAAAAVGGGFALDVAADPTSYVGLGVVRKANLARNAAEKQAKKAGLKPAEVAAAGKKAADKAGTGKTWTLDLGRASRPKKIKLKDRDPDGPIRTFTHPVTRHVTPSPRAPGIDEATHDTHKAAQRKGRAAGMEMRQRAQAVDQLGRRGKRGRVKRFTPEENRQIIDAIESKSVKHIKDQEVRLSAQEVIDTLDDVKRVERAHGVHTKDLTTPEERIAHHQRELDEAQGQIKELSAKPKLNGKPPKAPKLASSNPHRYKLIRPQGAGKMLVVDTEQGDKVVNRIGNPTQAEKVVKELNAARTPAPVTLAPSPTPPTTKAQRHKLVAAEKRADKAAKELKTAIDEAPDSARGYFPHVGLEEKPGLKDRFFPKQGLVHKASPEHTRTNRTTAKARRGTDDQLQEDVRVALATRLRESSRRLEAQPVLDELKASGRPYPTIGGKAARRVPLKQDEAVYRFQSGKPPVKVLPDDSRAGDVILDDKHASQVLKRLEPVMQWPVVDHFNRAFKQVVRISPQYHARNYYGDTSLSYQSGATATDIAHGNAAALAYVSRAQHSRKHLIPRPPNPKGRGVKIDGKKMSYDELVHEAQTHGADLGGIVVGDVVDEAAKRGKKVRGAKFSKAREAGPRLATYIGARRRGLSPDDAADWMHQHHPDYGDLTHFERKYGKRVYPFYTYSARNLPAQVRKLATRPGRFAHFQALREEASKQAGLDLGWEGKDTQKYEQRGTPIPIKVGGKTILVMPMLPLNDISRLSADPQELKDLTIGSVTPLIKTPLELGTNHSFFFGRQIKNEYKPLVAAPPRVRNLPADVRKKLGITKGKDPSGKTNKTVWLMPAYTSYGARALGPAAGQAIQFNAAPNTDLRALSYGLGPKFSKLDPKLNEKKNLQKELYEKVHPKLNKARQRDDKKDIKRLTKKQGKLDKSIRKIDKSKGYANPHGPDR